METALTLIFALALAFGICALRAAIVMWLWNGILVALFGLPALTFWVAWGIMILCNILFKGCAHITTKRE